SDLAADRSRSGASRRRRAPVAAPVGTPAPAARPTGAGRATRRSPVGGRRSSPHRPGGACRPPWPRCLRRANGYPAARRPGPGRAEAAAPDLAGPVIDAPVLRPPVLADETEGERLLLGGTGHALIVPT